MLHLFQKLVTKRINWWPFCVILIFTQFYSVLHSFTRLLHWYNDSELSIVICPEIKISLCLGFFIKNDQFFIEINDFRQKMNIFDTKNQPQSTMFREINKNFFVIVDSRAKMTTFKTKNSLCLQISSNFWSKMAVLTTDIRRISNNFFDKNNNFVHNRRHYDG